MATQVAGTSSLEFDDRSHASNGQVLLLRGELDASAAVAAAALSAHPAATSKTSKIEAETGDESSGRLLQGGEIESFEKDVAKNQKAPGTGH